MAFWTLLAVAAISVAVNLLLAPRPKAPKPDEVQELELPTAEAGRPIPVVFGTMRVKGLNILWYGEKSSRQSKVKA